MISELSPSVSDLICLDSSVDSKKGKRSSFGPCSIFEIPKNEDLEKDGSGGL